MDKKDLDSCRILYKSISGGSVSASYSEVSKEETENLDAAIFLAELGKKVILLPAMNSMKTADAVMDDEFWEIKTNHKPTKSAIDHSLHKAKTQAKKVILNIKSLISDEDLWRGINGRIFRTEIEELFLIRNKKVRHFKIVGKNIEELT